MKIRLPLFAAVGGLLASSALFAAPDSINTSTSTTTEKPRTIQVNVQKETTQSSQQSVRPSMGSVTEDARLDQNDRIMRNVQDKLKGTYKNYNINIHVLDGVVTLTGSVKSSQDKLNIESDVSALKDVKKVDNKLEVTNSVPRINN